MYASNPYELQRAFAQVRPLERDQNFWAICIALKLFQRVHRQGWLGRLGSVLTGRRHSLFDLKAVEDTCTVRGRRYGGLRAVPLARIRGSDGRENDFDAGFHPLRIDDKDRWVSIAVACKTGTALPPVELIQVGDVFFVRDGHHRVSVARALGQVEIDAEVIVWDVVGPLPWERPAISRHMAVQPV